jgi:hypothetical protein
MSDVAGERLGKVAINRRMQACMLVLQLLFLRGSESMGNHDSSIVDADGVD